ncbi:hypothetical protein ABER98_17000 [Domibacillus aminovorans]|uniref:hypothetical protein n=1 Tax=Domibacillus aminovorans TaxID=29332 RepID=UPI003D20A900
MTKIVRFISGNPEYVKLASAICSLSLMMQLESSLLKEDYDRLIDLAIMTGDQQWFFELGEKMLQDA